MVAYKYDREIAQRPVKLIRSPQGDKRNMRILLARGLKHDIARQVVDAIRSGMVSAPDSYAWTVARNEKNLDDDYKRRKGIGNSFRERIKNLNEQPLPTLEEQRLEAAHAISEDDALTTLPDLIRDDEVRLPKPKKRRNRQSKQQKRSGPRVYATPARDREAREAMKELRANQ